MIFLAVPAETARWNCDSRCGSKRHWAGACEQRMRCSLTRPLPNCCRESPAHWPESDAGRESRKQPRLSSWERVELLGALEDAIRSTLAKPICETMFANAATVGDLEKLLLAGQSVVAVVRGGKPSNDQRLTTHDLQAFPHSTIRAGLYSGRLLGCVLLAISSGATGDVSASSAAGHRARESKGRARAAAVIRITSPM